MNNAKAFLRNIAKKAILFVMILSMVLYSVPVANFFTTVHAADSQFNRNLSNIGSSWLVVDATVSGSTITTTTQGQAMKVIIIDDVDLQSAIDLGTVSVSTSLGVNVSGLEQEPAAGDLHNTSLKIRVGVDAASALASSPIASESKDSALDESFTLSTSANIPAGTRCILIGGDVITQPQPGGGEVTTTLTSSNTTISDTASPTVTPAYNSAWINENINVVITANDNVGVKGIYSSDDTLLISESTYSYTVTDEGDNISSFYAIDFAGNKSEIVDVNVNNIDKTNPQDIQNPTLNIADWTNQEVTVTFNAITQVDGTSPERYSFSSDGGSTYQNLGGNVHTVLEQGEVAWTYRIFDEAGNVSLNTVTAVTKYDITNPSIDNIAKLRSSGQNKYTISVSDAHSGVANVKYAPGNQNAEYFNSNGIALSSPYEIVSNTAQDYTIYVIDNAGNETIDLIPAENILPSINAVADVTINEDTSTTIDITASDDATAEADLVISLISSDSSVVADAAAYYAGGWKIDIQPKSDANTNSAPITMTVRCLDGSGEYVETNFNLTVNSVNDAPVAVQDDKGTVQNADVVISALLNDTDVENSPLSIVSFTQAGNGTVTQDGNDFVYSPNVDWAGTDSFTYIISDGQLTAEGTVTITVSNVNDAPNAVDDSKETIEDTTLIIDVLSNDSDPDTGIDPLEKLTVTLDNSNQASLGTVTVNTENNTIEYIPNENAFGTDTFGYILTDAQGLMDTASVTVTIKCENDEPVLQNVPASLSAVEDSQGNIFTFSVSDIETATEDLMVQVVSMNKSIVRNENISVALDTATGECTVTYAPIENTSGTLQLKVLLSDGIATIVEYIDLTVSSGNDAPIAQNDDMTDDWKVYEDTPKSLDLSVLKDNDSDIDGDSLNITEISAVSSGSFTLTGGETYTYIPQENYHGTVTFTYTVSDGTVADTAQATFNVRKKDDAPVLTLDESNVYQCVEDLFVQPINLSVSDVDTDLDHLYVTVESTNETLISSDNITITNNNDGTYSISLAEIPPKQGLTKHKNGSTNLKIYLSDGINTVSETVTYTVTPAQDAPVALDDTYNIEEAGREYIIPIANDYDYDDEALSLASATSFTQPQAGTVEVYNNGFLYTAPADEIGTYTFQYTITDGIDQATATVTLVVGEAGENKAPRISEISDIDVMANNSIGSIAFTVTDEDAIQQVTAVSSNQSIIADGDISITNSSDNYTLTIANPTVVGTAYITITAVDEFGKSSVRQFAVNVFPENKSPVANNDLFPLAGASVLAYEDTDFAFTAQDLLANDTDIEGDELSVVFVSSPDDDYSYITGNGADYVLHPQPNRNGNITFTYYITDGYTTSNTATATVYFIPINDRPNGENDYYTLVNEVGAVLTVLADDDYPHEVVYNDHDVEGDELTVARVESQPSFGIVNMNSDGSFTYTRTEASTNENGEDSFTYTVTDGLLEESTPTTVFIRSSYDPDFNIYYRSDACHEDDSAISIPIRITESNGYLGDYSLTNFSDLSLGTAEEGTATSRTNLTLLYTPNPGVSGTDIFEYEVTDNLTGKTKKQSVHVRIIPVNDAPTFVVLPENNWTENEDGSKTLNVQFADEDHDISDLELEVYLTNQSNSSPVALDENITVQKDINDPSKATATIPFVPNRFGTFTVVFNISDGIDSTQATSNGEVLPVDDPPSTPDRSTTLNEDTFAFIDIMDEVTDIDTSKSDLVLTIESTTSNGTASISGGSIQYIPNLNFYGIDTLTYRVASKDDASVYSEGQVEFTVTGINDAPVIYDIDYYVVTDEDTTATVNFKSFDYEDDESDADGDVTTYTFSTSNSDVIPLSAIAMAVDSENSEQKVLTIAPNANKFGSVELTVTATDSQGKSTTLDFKVNVVSVNDLPDAVDDTAEVNEDEEIAINVLVNDTDYEDDEYDSDDLELTVIEVSACTHGKTTINNNTNEITYTPDANYNGSDSFTYTITDSFGDTDTATVNVTVVPVNDPPVAEDDEGEVLEGGTVTINLLENDWDIELMSGESVYPLEIVSVSDGVFGSVSFENGILTYVASDDLDVDKVETLTYVVTDSAEGTDTDEGTVTINIIQVNDPPAAESAESNNTIVVGTIEKWIFDEDTTGVFVVDIEDAETLANQLLVSISISEEGRALVADSNISMRNLIPSYDKEITLVPYANAFGEFNITFTVGDGETETTVVFPVKILPVNDLPQLTVHNMTTTEEQAVSDTASATDVEEPLTFVYSISSNPSNGTASISPVTGKYIYTPNSDFVGEDTFDVTVTDGDGGMDTETVKVIVSQINDAPTADDDSYTIDEGATSKLEVLVGDTDPDLVYGDSLKIIAVTQPEHGTARIVNDAVLGWIVEYEPEAYNNNPVTFTYTISDNEGLESIATVTVNFNSLDNDPANGDDVIDILEDKGVDTYDILSNDDVDIDPELNETITDLLTILSVTPNVPGNSDICEIATIDGKTYLRYEPADNFFGTDVIKYTMKDDNTPDGTSYEFTVIINVEAVNDIPTINAAVDSLSSNEDNSLSTTADISDVETDADTLVVTASWDNDTLINRVDITTTGGTRTITVVPEDDMFGEAIITLTVEDEHGGKSTDTINVTVNSQEDIPDPTVGIDRATTDENTVVYIDVLKNDDVDANLEGEVLRIVPDTITMTSTEDYGGTYQVVQRTVQRERLNADGSTYTESVTRDVIAYTPNADWSETSQQVQVLSYQMYEQSTPAVIYDANNMVSVTITPVNDAPTIQIDLSDRQGAGDIGTGEDSIAMDEDTVGGSGNIIVRVDDEEDGDAVVLSLDSLVEHIPNSLPDDPLVLDSDIALSSPGTENVRHMVITSQPDESGVFDVTLIVTDKDSDLPLTATDTIKVTINPVQDAPVNGDDLFITAEDTPITLDVLLNDDVDTTTQGSESTLVSIETQPAHGTAVKVGNKVMYTPDLNYYNDSEGPLEDDIFTYKMEDGNGAVAIFTVTMYVTPVNDEPVLTFFDDEAPDDNKVTTLEDTNRVIKLYFEDVDNAPADIQMTGISSNPLIINVPLGGMLISDVQTDEATPYFLVTLDPFGRWNGYTDLTFTATDTITRVTGIHKPQSIQTVQLTITPVNESPDAITDNLSGNEGNVISLNVLLNDQDPDFDADGDGVADDDEIIITDVSFAPGEVNSHVGDLAISPTKKKIIFTPANGYEDWNGVLHFEYEITDLGGLKDSVVSQLTINQVNDNPVAAADSATLDEDTSVNIDIITNDSDVDINPSTGETLNNMPYTESLTYKVDGFGGVENGVVTVVNSTTINFEPSDNFNGIEEFTYTLIDNNGGSATGTVTVTVNPIEDDPTAQNDEATTSEETLVSIDALSNDSDTDSQDFNTDLSAKNTGVLTITKVDTQAIAEGETVTLASGNGTVKLEAGELKFTPAADFVGEETFSYTIANSDGRTHGANVKVIVNNVNDAPVAKDHSAPAIDETDGTVSLTFDVDDIGTNALDLISDIDLDVSANNEELTVTLSTPITEPGHVTLDQSTNVITYTPQENWNGTFEITYRVTDKGGLYDEGKITVVVNPIEDDPTAQNDEATTSEETLVSIDALSNDSDIDSHDFNTDLSAKNTGVLTITKVDTQAIAEGETVNLTSGNGTVKLEAGELKFTPAADFVGEETFSYTIANSDGRTHGANVKVIVNNVNDAPVAKDHSAPAIDETDGTVSLTFDVDDIGTNAIDLISDIDLDVSANNEELTVTLSTPITEPGHVTLDQSTNVITYTPQEDWNGTFEITYRVTDKGGLYDEGKITVVVNPIEDDPTAQNDEATTAEETLVSIDVLNNDSDIDSQDFNTDLSAKNTGVLTITKVDTQAIAEGETITLASGNGTVKLEAGELKFTPAADFVGEETFSYTIANSDGRTHGANVKVIVNNVNDAPVAKDHSAPAIDETDGTVSLTFDVDDIGTNAIDLISDIDLDVSANNEELTVTLSTPITEPGHVTLDQSTNVITYTPQKDWNGTFEITYRVTDKGGLYDEGKITVVVNPIEDDPTAQNDEATTAEETLVSIDVLNNDSDIDSQDFNTDLSAKNTGVLTITKVDTQAIAEGETITLASGNGTVKLEAGELKFTPAADFVGEETFSYTIANSDGRTHGANVKVIVNNVNDAPVAKDHSAPAIDETDGTVSLTFDVDDIGTNAIDLISDIDLDVSANNEELTVTLSTPITEPGHVTLDQSTNVITYTPQENWNGTFEITYRVTDKGGLYDEGKITVVVNPIEDDPTAQNDEATTSEETLVSIDALSNDSDMDSQDFNTDLSAKNTGVLTITKVDTQAIAEGETVNLTSGNGNVKLEAGELKFTPAADFVGEETFSYTIANSDGRTHGANVKVTVNNVNDAPVADNHTKVIDETDGDITLQFDVDDAPLNLVSDVDLDVTENGEELTIELVTVHEDVEFDAATNTISYTPKRDWNGTIEITYKATDKSNESDTGIITVKVNSVGDAPVLSTESYTINEDEYTPSSVDKWFNMDVLSNDTDVDEITNPDFEDLNITDLSFSQDNVRLVVSSDSKSVNFQSDENWNGVVNFTYTVTDAYGISRSMNSKITVNQVYDAPSASEDAASTSEDTPITFSLIGNDTDVDIDVVGNSKLNNDPVADVDVISINESDVLGAANGTISLNNGVLTYTPKADFNGVENLRYTLIDEHGGTSQADITITILPQLDDPRAKDDGVSLDEDDAFKEIYPLDNDYNPDSDTRLNAVPDSRPLVIQSIDLSGMPLGAGSITNNGDHLYYEPSEHYEGTFTISYTCVNGNGGTDTADITIYVAQVYDEPVGENIEDSMDEDAVYAVDLDDYISDVDAGTVFTLSVAADGLHGHATIDAATHVLTYTPEKDYNGEDKIVYRVEDNQLLSDTGEITLTINQVNDAPVTTDDTASSDEDVAVTINVIANDSDIDTDVLLNADPAEERITVEVDGFADVDNGTVEILENETSILFTPESNWHGTEVFTYTCVDVTGVEVTAEVTVTINPVNDTPVFNSYKTTVDEDSSITYTASTLIFDPDIESIGDEVTLSLVTQAQNGTVQVVDNKVTYTPDENFNGDDVFTIKVVDKDGEESVETFRMTVEQVNDIPRARNASVSTDEDTQVVFDLLSYGSDVDMQRDINKYPGRESIRISSIGKPSHGTAVLSADGTVTYTSDENYHGVDGFEYTIKDNSGATSTAYVELFVKSKDDIPVLVEFTTPYAGNAYKSGHRLPVEWLVDNPDDLQIVYTLSFFDGEKWSVIGSLLTEEEYIYTINEYITETDKAQFSVFGTLSDGTEINTIYSDVFIVDNVAPSNTQYVVSPARNSVFSPMVVNINSGQDLIEFEYLYQIGENGELVKIKNNQFTLNNNDGAVKLYARDKLGNIVLVDTIAFRDYINVFGNLDALTGLLLLAGLLIILLLRYRNIKFVFTYADEKTKTVQVYRRHKDNGIGVKLKDKWFEGAISVEMTMKKRITEKMLGNRVTVFREEAVLKEVKLPKDLRDKFTDRIM